MKQRFVRRFNPNVSAAPISREMNDDVQTLTVREERSVGRAMGPERVFQHRSSFLSGRAHV